jgi:hypothetical protein
MRLPHVPKRGAVAAFAPAFVPLLNGLTPHIPTPAKSLRQPDACSIFSSACRTPVCQDESHAGRSCADCFIRVVWSMIDCTAHTAAKREGHVREGRAMVNTLTHKTVHSVPRAPHLRHVLDRHLSV